MKIENEEKIMMKTKKLLAFLLASAMMCTAFTACGDKEDSSKEESSAAETTRKKPALLTKALLQANRYRPAASKSRLPLSPAMHIWQWLTVSGMYSTGAQMKTC